MSTCAIVNISHLSHCSIYLLYYCHNCNLDSCVPEYDDMWFSTPLIVIAESVFQIRVQYQCKEDCIYIYIYMYLLDIPKYGTELNMGRL